MPLLNAASEDTIELELSKEQMLSLSRAAAAIRAETLPAQPQTLPVATARKTLPTVAMTAYRRSTWPAVVFSIVATSALSGAIAYFATTPAPTLPVSGNPVSGNPVVRSAATESPSPPPAETARVQFANPFDANEVFEFPSNTSETEARQAVAQVLLQRAQERQNAAKITHQRRKAADHVVSAGATPSRPSQLTRVGGPQELPGPETRPSL